MLAESRRGVEKESLRVRPDGQPSLAAHPQGLGSALTHPHITTDFGEAQLELVTGVHDSIPGMLEELRNIHLFVARHLGDEMLWPLSAPGQILNDACFPHADYGTSNQGRLKQLYRVGLAHRYGNRMQAVSGVHYNFSFSPELWPLLGIGPNQGYMHCLRNLRRHLWLLVYLFGASPLVDASYVEGRAHHLQQLPQGLGLPHATCLRMSGIGYVSEAQIGMGYALEHLDGYLAELYRGLNTPWPDFERIGVRDGERFLQMSTSVLQIENEFYSPIRAKAAPVAGERPITALARRGIEYMELRCLDLNPLHPEGLDSQQVHLVEALLWYCLLADSPSLRPGEARCLQDDFVALLNRGREPGLVLSAVGASPVKAGQTLLTLLVPVAQALDTAAGDAGYSEAVALAREMLGRGGGISARVLEEMGEHRHSDWGLECARQHQREHCQATLSDDVLGHFDQLAAASVEAQRVLEDERSGGFVEHLAAYLGQA